MDTSVDENNAGTSPEQTDAGTSPQQTDEVPISETGTANPGEAALTPEQAAKVDALIDRMKARLAQLETAGDNRRVFLEVYLAMTTKMARSLRGGNFLDPSWACRLTDNFADLYFAADDAFEAGTGCPAVWERTFTIAREGRATTVEHALLGINAHITYDLPMAVARTIRDPGDDTLAHGRPPPDVLARRRYDFEVVNQLIAETIDVVQTRLARRFLPLRLLDPLAGRVDEYLAARFLRSARTQGWPIAVALLSATTDPEQERIRKHLEAVALHAARNLDLLGMVPAGVARQVARRLLRRPA